MRGCTEIVSSKTADIASSINSLLHLEEADPASLLDVIENYFTSPSAHSSVDSDSDSDNELDHNVAGNCNENHDKITNTALKQHHNYLAECQTHENGYNTVDPSSAPVR